MTTFKKKVVLWDIDGTLADGGHRIHLMPEDKTHTSNFDAFNKACADDPLVPQTAAIFFALRDQMLAGEAPFQDFYFLTSRCEVCHDETVEFLNKTGLGVFPMIMRNKDEHRAPVDFKSAMLDDLEAEGIDIYMAFDDDLEVVNMMKSRGIYALHVAEWWKSGFKVN